MTTPTNVVGAKSKSRCHRFLCFREAVGFIQIDSIYGVILGGLAVKIPYCKKHGEIAKQIVEESEVKKIGNGKYRLVANPPKKGNSK